MIVRCQFVYCDGGHECLYDGQPLDSCGGLTVAEQFQGSTWVRRGGKHYCPACAARLGYRKAKPETP